MRSLFGWLPPLALLVLPQLTHAQDAPAPDEAIDPTLVGPLDNPPLPPPVAGPSAEALRAELTAAQGEAALATEQLAWLEAVHALAVVLLDDRQAMADRTAAAATLARSEDPRVLAFLRAAAQSRAPDLQQACVDAAATVSSPESLALMDWVARDVQSPLDSRLHTLDVLSTLDTREAGVLLWELADDEGLHRRIRTAARTQLEAHYPTLSDELGGPRKESHPIGKALVVATTGNVGGTVLGAVGSFGRYDATAVGATGGALIGTSAGILVARTTPVTLGQGLAYTSSAGVGEALGGFAGVAVLGTPWHTPYDSQRRRRQANLMPAFLAVGSAGGALVGRHIVRGQPEVADVFEVDTSIYLGSALAVAALDVAAYHPSEELRLDGTQQEWDAYRDTQSRLRSGANIVGATGGALVGRKIAESWELGWEDGLFTGLVAAEASWVGWYWPKAVGLDDTHLRGTLRLPLHGAMIGGLAWAERNPITWEQSLVGGWTAVNGNLLGAGIPRLFDNKSEKAMARVMLPAGLASTWAGVHYAHTVEADVGGWAMVGVGVPLVSANAAVLSDRAYWKGRVTDTQAGGIVMTTTGMAGLGLWAANTKVDPDWQDWTVTATGAGWGAFYGTAIPIATESQAPGYNRRLLLIGLTDAGALGGRLLVTDRVGVKPIETVLPQLSGVAGGAVAAIGVAMFSNSDADLATGALIGSTVGLGAGSLLQRRLSQRGGSDILVGALPRPRIHLPGSWAPTVQPHIDSYGEPGLKVGLQGVGW